MAHIANPGQENGERMNETNFSEEDVKDVQKALKSDIPKEQIKAELEEYVRAYQVPLRSAKRAIVKNRGGDPRELMGRTKKKIKDIKGEEQGLEVKGRIVSINDKEIEVDGDKRRIKYGILGDETATVPFTIWNDPPIVLEEDDTVLLRNVYTTLWQDDPQINIGQHSDMEKLDDEEIESFINEVAINEIESNMNGIKTVGRVLQLEDQTINNRDDEEQLIYKGILGDETGKVQVTFWDKKDIEDGPVEQGKVIEIEGGQGNEFKGMPQLSVNESTKVNEVSDEQVPPQEEIDMVAGSVSSIEKVEEKGGGIDLRLEGTFIDLKDGSGLIFRCPECNRVIQSGACRVHGNVEGKSDLRIKGVLDDGTGAVSLIAPQEVTEGVLGYDLEQAMEKAKEAMGSDIISDDLEEILLASPLKVRGNVTTGDYGLMLQAESIEKNDAEVEDEAEKLLQRLEKIKEA